MKGQGGKAGWKQRIKGQNGKTGLKCSIEGQDEMQDGRAE